MIERHNHDCDDNGSDNADNERALVYVCEDRGVSGKADLTKRPGLLEAIAATKEHNAGILLVFRHDRLSRSVSKGAMIEDLLARDGVRVMSTDGVGNEDSPEGRLQKNVIKAVSEYERDIIALRTRAALHSKQLRGRRHTCRAPYGYRWTDDGGIEASKSEQRTIEKIVALRAEGGTIESILAHLIDHPKEHPPRTGWHMTTVYRIVRRHEEDLAAAAAHESLVPSGPKKAPKKKRAALHPRPTRE